jgi:hypothetical protein
MSSMIGSERASLLRQRVLDVSAAGSTSGNLRGVALDDPLLLERPQPQRQRARADPRQRAFELTEARAALGQVAHQQQRPLAAHDSAVTAHRTCLIDGHFNRYFTN